MALPGGMINLPSSSDTTVLSCGTRLVNDFIPVESSIVSLIYLISAFAVGTGFIKLVDVTLVDKVVPTGNVESNRIQIV